MSDPKSLRNATSLVRFEQLKPEFGIHYDRRTLNRMIERGDFPAPRELSEHTSPNNRRIAWHLADIEKWIDGLQKVEPRKAKSKAAA